MDTPMKSKPGDPHSSSEDNSTTDDANGLDQIAIVKHRSKKSKRARLRQRDRCRSPVRTEKSNNVLSSKTSENECTTDYDGYCNPLGLVEVDLEEYQDRVSGADSMWNEIYSSDEEGADAYDAEEKDGDEYAEPEVDNFQPADKQFQWFPVDSFDATEEPFKPTRTGCPEAHRSPYSAFRSYWDDEILEYIVQEINAYAATNFPQKFKAQWVPTNKEEILVVFAFWTMLGIIPMPTIHSCFSVNPLLETSVFRRMFKRQRYLALARALHFIDSSNEDGLSRIGPILTHLNEKFKSNYIPSRNVSIDECLNLWKGRPDNVAKYKILELCESSTGYLWSFIVTTGKYSSLTNRYSPKNTSAVMTLIEPLLNKGYRVFMSKWFTSPPLARYLKRNGTDCVGILRFDRVHVPSDLNQCKLKKGEFLARHSGDICLLVWQDTKKVTIMSTCHGVDPPDVVSKVGYKPQVVIDYNKHCGCVDQKNQAFETTQPDRRRNTNWYMKVFRRLIACSILNARVLYQSSTDRVQDHLEFRLSLVEDILARHQAQCPDGRTIAVTYPSRKTFTSAGPHFPVRVPQLPRDVEMGRSSRKNCFWCARYGEKKRKSPYQCEQCDVVLCIEGCYKAFHLSLK